jgi:clan AA aspartic protease
MITGLVTSNREAVICVLVRGPQGKETQIEAIIDTGFNGFLTLPPQFIADLALPFAGTTRAALGDGSEVQMDVFEATVLWDNQERSVVSLGAAGGALLGMSMLSWLPYNPGRKGWRYCDY